MVGLSVVACLGGILSIVIINTCVRAVDAAFFPARAAFEPSVLELSEALARTTDTAGVTAVVEAAARAWLGCAHVRLELAGDTGESKASPRDLDCTWLSRPMTFCGERLGEIRVARMTGGALFNSEDRALLQTISNQTALALAHARNRMELESRRREETEAWKGERQFILETIAAEISHELRCPINFFQSILSYREEASCLEIEACDLEIGWEELERVERMLARLDRLGHAPLELRPTSLRALVQRAEVLLRDELTNSRFEVAIDGPDEIVCDPDKVTQMLINLLSNAIDATATTPGARIGVDWRVSEHGATLSVWDEGPGFSSSAHDLFQPWITSKPRGSGLGLAITRRLARAHGWAIAGHCRGGRTRFVISIPDALGSVPRERERELGLGNSA